MANVLGFIKKAFPFISAAAGMGGPIGVIAANLVGKALNVSSVDPTADGISTAIAGATPEQLIALKEAEAQCQVQMQQLGFQNSQELEDIAERDRESARARQIALKDRMPAILAACYSIGFFGVLALVSRGVNPQAKDIMNTMIGVLAGALVQIGNYYWGSSAGSARKTEILANGSH